MSPVNDQAGRAEPVSHWVSLPSPRPRLAPQRGAMPLPGWYRMAVLPDAKLRHWDLRGAKPTGQRSLSLLVGGLAVNPSRDWEPQCWLEPVLFGYTATLRAACLRIVPMRKEQTPASADYAPWFNQVASFEPTPSADVIRDIVPWRFPQVVALPVSTRSSGNGQG
jgi:hypothetical protein